MYNIVQIDEIKKFFQILTGLANLQGVISERSFQQKEGGEIRMTDSELEHYVRLYRRNVFAAALCLVRNEYDADDITQEAFMRLYKYGGTFNDDEHVKAWLIRCAVNRGKTLLGSRWRKFAQPLESAAELIHTDSYNDDSTILRLIGKLNKNNRITLHMYYYEGYRAEQIADILGISTNAVISRLSRARRQLKKLISEERNDDNGLQRTVR